MGGTRETESRPPWAIAAVVLVLFGISVHLALWTSLSYEKRAEEAALLRSQVIMRKRIDAWVEQTKRQHALCCVATGSAAIVGDTEILFSQHYGPRGSHP